MLTTVESALKSANINENQISFPLAIDKSTYSKVKKMLSDIRGQWNGGKKQFFSFNYDPTDIVNRFLVDGVWPKLNPFAFFPTPPCMIEYALKYTYAGASYNGGKESIRILEPSAGQGQFVDAVVNDFRRGGIEIEVVCVELDPVNAAILREKGYTCVIEKDFLSMTIDELGEFDLIIQNPPFKGLQYVKHILHAQTMLSTSGKLVAVAPTSLFKATNQEAMQLRDSIAAINFGDFDDCVFGSGTFDNTDIETMIVTLPSQERLREDIKQIKSLAAQNFMLFVNNMQDLNHQVMQCKSLLDLKVIQENLFDRYLLEHPFAYFNDEIKTLGLAALGETLEIETTTVPKHNVKPKWHGVEEKSNRNMCHLDFKKMSKILDEIGDVLAIDAKSLTSVAKKNKKIEHHQIEMAF